MSKKRKMKEKEEATKKETFTKVVALISLLISLFSLIVSILIRHDTEELNKFTTKPLYYVINLYPNSKTNTSEIHDKYASLHLNLVVDDFEVKKKNYLDINYNSTFTKVKYFMVYDYSLSDKTYKYMRYGLDERNEAIFKYDNDYKVVLEKMNYSFTPNKNYLYVLINTSNGEDENLDLVFFSYHDNGQTFKLDTINEDGKDKIDINIINNDIVICKDYFMDLWAKDDTQKQSDIEFMFDVYKDLSQKLFFK